MRFWFEVMLIVYASTTLITTIIGMCAVGGEDTVVIVKCLNFCYLFALLVKGLVFWWGCVLRLSQAGRVASGKMVKECLDETDNAGQNYDPFTQSCNPEGVFQAKSGKFMLAVIIMGVFCGLC